MINMKLKPFALLLFATAATAQEDTWDVTDTGQPFTEVEFTVTEGTWMSVDVSPDGRTLLFDMLGDIYSIPASGGDATLVRGGPAMQRQPRFSPDGKRILFLSDASGGDNLWVANVDGSDPKQVSQETLNKVTNPAWAPDGRYVVAQKSYTTVAGLLGGSEIWMFHLEGGMGRILVPAPETKKTIHEPTFSPDGGYLYYTEDVNLAPAAVGFRNANQPNFATKRRDLASGETRQIIGGFGSATTAQISPDGKRIAFVRRVKEKTVLFVYNTDTGEQRPVYDALDRDAQVGIGQYGYYPHFDWFPDSRSIAIWGKGKIFNVDVDESVATEIAFRVTTKHRITDAVRFENTLTPERFTVRSIRQIAVAPGGDVVAFNALGRLWQKTLPDGEPRRLTSDDNFEYEPAYSPDGRRIAYVGWDDERGGSLRVIPSGGGPSRIIVESNGGIRTPTFSPDGNRIAYVIQRPSDLMGGYRARPGIYWVPAGGGDAAFVTETGTDPKFSSDGERLYYNVTSGGLAGASYNLESVRLDGLDKREHATGTDAMDFRLSPDHRWLAFRQHYQYYVMPYPMTGSAISVMAATTELPVARLTQHAGYDLTWSADASTLHWMLGEELFSVSVEEQLGADATMPESGISIGLEVSADTPEGLVAFTNGRIITMQGEQVIENGTLVVEGNRIAALGPTSEVTVPEGAAVIDARGKTLMPGLVDMHGHVGLFVQGLAPQKHPSHYAALAFGVTTNFDPSTADQPNYAIGEMNLAGGMVGPRLLSSGEVIYGLGGAPFYVPIANFEDARSAIARKRALGGVVIKSYMQPMRAQRQQLIKAAREAEIMVTPEGELHFYNDISMILDGHMSIEHNIPLANYYDDVVQLMANGGTATTPTLIVSAGELFGENYIYQTTQPWNDPKVKTYIQNTLSVYSPLGGAAGQPPYVRGMLAVQQADELWDIGFRATARALKKLDDAGVLVNAGGHGQIQGLNIHWDMWLLAEGGWENHRVLRAATINGATTIGLDTQIGTLEVGKLADLIVLDANPLENIRNTNTVRYTMVNGRLYESLSMNEIGNYDRPRTKFYWELPDYNGIEWNEAWSGDDTSIMGGVRKRH